MHRNLDRYSRIKPSITFCSIKNHNPQYCESTLEHETLYALEFDKAVIAYRTQPESYSYTRQGQQRRYTPDLLIKYSPGFFQYEEVKSEKEARSLKFIEKFSFLQFLFHDRIGVPLKLRIGRPTNTKLLRWLYTFRWREANSDLLKLLHSTSKDKSTFKSLKALADRNGFSEEDLLVLVAHGHLHYNLDIRPRDETVLEIVV